MAPKAGEETDDKAKTPVDDDTDAGKKNGAADDGDTGNISPETQAEIDDLKKRLDMERAAREDAENRARHSAKVAVVAQSEVDDANLQVVTTAIDTVAATQSALKARYRDALASQDYDAAADIQSEMSTNAAKLVQLQSGKASLEEEREAAKNKPRVQPQPVVADPVEALARTLTPKSAAWVRAHPDYVNDAKKNRQMIRAHEDAIDDGHAPDSDGYFKYVEDRLKIQKGTSAGAGDAALSNAAGGKGRDSGTGRGAPPPNLPANRGGGGGNARRLTQDQKEAAAACDMTEEEYAANLDALKADGKIH